MDGVAACLNEAVAGDTWAEPPVLAHVPKVHDEAAATALWRGQVVERIMRQIRQEVLAPRMVQALLDGLVEALDGEGAVVLDLLAGPDTSPELHVAGEPGPALASLFAGLQVETSDPVLSIVDDRPVLACPTYTRFGGRAGLCVWRAPGAAPWTDDDARLVSPLVTVLRMVLEHEAIELQLARQSRTDALTGLLNRGAFLEEVSRRIERLHRDDLPGTLMLVGLDRLKRLNETCGQEAGDQALKLLAGLLRGNVRPADLVARLGGNEFALWLDGSDELTVAERAEHLRLDGPAAFAEALPQDAPIMTTSIGVASRHPRAAETLEDVMQRASLALNDVKRANRGHWRVALGPLD